LFFHGEWTDPPRMPTNITVEQKENDVTKLECNEMGSLLLAKVHLDPQLCEAAAEVYMGSFDFGPMWLFVEFEDYSYPA
ncbi:hypothetical protein CR513_52801, partial [Mucuna pruriens]